MGPSHLTMEQIDVLDEKFRNKWRALLSVDDMVKEVIEELESQVILCATH